MEAEIIFFFQSVFVQVLVYAGVCLWLQVLSAVEIIYRIKIMSNFYAKWPASHAEKGALLGGR